ncbi:hypothetical protein HHK36_020424 [Tetracentron sinense]|uniref:RPM1 interacting protein 13 n=1 Tax=Tetracentron sinense TaxID=13715 RepID=A0A835DB04_TETSI|nr:hypothetical protein HHK36_020424 [Tetracentron sinense]
MDSNSVIFDISSDDDGGWDNHDDENLDWLLSELFDNETEESSDVVIVDEVSCGSAIQKQSYKPSNAAKSAFRDDLDDDCLILDCDPDNPVPVVNDTEDGSDELLVVGEKGQLACRDYPHSRHLCAKFPFNLTPHEKYCDMCHCYVCDSHAPCIYWGTGVSIADHCHSTDKEEIWKVQRTSFKQGRTASLPFRKFPGTTLPMTPPLPDSVPALSLSESFTGPLHSVSKPTPLRACSSSTSFGVPNIASHGSNTRPGFTLGRNRIPQTVSRSQLVPDTNNFIQRERSGGVGGTIGPQFGSPHAKFKRTPRNHHPAATLNDNNHIRWQDFLADINSEPDTYQSPFQPNMGNIFAESQFNMMSSQPQVYNQPIPQLNDDQNMYLHGNLAPNAANRNPSDFNFSWINSTGQSIQQQTSAEDSHFQSIQPTYEPSSVTESDLHVPVITNSGSSDFHLESWMYSVEPPPIPVAAEDAMPSELDYIPLQPASGEPGLLFDLGGPWNDLAQV